MTSHSRNAHIKSLNKSGEIISKNLISPSDVEYLRIDQLNIKNLDLKKYASLKEIWINQNVDISSLDTQHPNNIKVNYYSTKETRKPNSAIIIEQNGGKIETSIEQIGRPPERVI